MRKNYFTVAVFNRIRAYRASLLAGHQELMREIEEWRGRLKTLAAAGLIGLGAASCDKNYNEPVGPDPIGNPGGNEDDKKGKDDDNTYDTRLYKDGKAYFPLEIESGYLDDNLQECGTTTGGEYKK